MIVKFWKKLFVFLDFVAPLPSSQAPEGARANESVVPDLTQTVKVKLDHSENLVKVFRGAKNGIFSQFTQTFSFQLQTSNFNRFSDKFIKLEHKK